MLKKLLLPVVFLFAVSVSHAQPPGWPTDGYVNVSGNEIYFAELGSGPNFIVYYLDWPTTSGGYVHFPLRVQTIPPGLGAAEIGAYLTALANSEYGNTPYPYPD